MILLKNELEKLLKHLNKSEDSIYSNNTVFELKEFIIEIINKIDNKIVIDIKTIEMLKLLNAPTGDLQETSMDNGWADDYLKISSEIDTILYSLYY